MYRLPCPAGSAGCRAFSTFKPGVYLLKARQEVFSPTNLKLPFIIFFHKGSEAGWLRFPVFSKYGMERNNRVFYLFLFSRVCLEAQPGFNCLLSCPKGPLQEHMTLNNDTAVGYGMAFFGYRGMAAGSLRC